MSALDLLFLLALHGLFAYWCLASRIRNQEPRTRYFEDACEPPGVSTTLWRILPDGRTVEYANRAGTIPWRESRVRPEELQNSAEFRETARQATCPDCRYAGSLDDDGFCHNCDAHEP